MVLFRQLMRNGLHSDIKEDKVQEKYYINIDENRRIVGRYLLSIHGENIPSTVQEVTEEVFYASMQENHNYLNEKLVSEIRNVRTEEELAEQERLAKLPTEEEMLNAKIELKAIELLTELELI